MEVSTIVHYSHTLIGSIGFISGIVALASKKGSPRHIMSGKLFIAGLIYSAVTVAYFMVEEFIPLAILMSVATCYFIFSSLIALRLADKKWRIISLVIAIIPAMLFAFTLFQFIQVLPAISLAVFGRLLFAVVFGIFFIKDIRNFLSPAERTKGLGQHAFRMIMAFGFALMAVLRIGVKLDFLGLAFTTVTPLAIALIVGFYTERNVAKFLK